METVVREVVIKVTREIIRINNRNVKLTFEVKNFEEFQISRARYTYSDRDLERLNKQSTIE